MGSRASSKVYCPRTESNPKTPPLPDRLASIMTTVQQVGRKGFPFFKARDLIHHRKRTRWSLKVNPIVQGGERPVPLE